MNLHELEVSIAPTVKAFLSLRATLHVRSYVEGLSTRSQQSNMASQVFIGLPSILL
jgi:hypothetical protein